MELKPNQYYLPEPSSWPIRASVGLFILLAGVANWLHSEWYGSYLTMIGAAIMVYVVAGWFGEVIRENREGKLSAMQVSNSFRYGMCWFIFSEVMFFGAFFGALFYIRVFALPMLGDTSSVTQNVLWPHFTATWPLLNNPDPTQYIAPYEAMSAWGIAAINTAILLTSGITITIAHFALLKNKFKTMIIAQAATILLGISFLVMQANEYIDAYMQMGLTLASGIYGSTFFMLTGFHGLHVTIGTICLMVILYRMLRRDFNSHHHFAFEAVSWYWHFVDVVWLLLFVFVYWL
jgi:cytochrome c oxidase subunit 3